MYLLPPTGHSRFPIGAAAAKRGKLAKAGSWMVELELKLKLDMGDVEPRSLGVLSLHMHFLIIGNNQ